MKHLIIISLLFIQNLYSQNLLSNYRKEFIWDIEINDFKPYSEKIKYLNAFDFDIKNSFIQIMDVTLNPIISKKYRIVSSKNEEETNSISFVLNDENDIEYRLVLFIDKNKLIIVVERDGNIYMTHYYIVTK